MGGIEYSGTNLEAIYHAEGRCTPNVATLFFYEYTVKDRLGNARVNFRANGSAIANLEDHHYYPFGMKMEGIGSSTVTNKYTYNYKELNEDFGLNWHDYGARWYDAALGRWWSVDPLAEPQANYSPYAYTYNNPLSFIDPTGMMGEDPAKGADNMTNEEWMDQTRPDGGYWANAKNELKKGFDPQEQTIEDFEGRKHRVGGKNFQRSTVTVVVGTRVEINGEVYHQEQEEYVYHTEGPEDPPYYYKGEKYNYKSTLYMAIWKDKVEEQMSVLDAFATGGIVMGLPLLKKRFVRACLGI